MFGFGALSIHLWLDALYDIMIFELKTLIV